MTRFTIFWLVVLTVLTVVLIEEQIQAEHRLRSIEGKLK